MKLNVLIMTPKLRKGKDKRVRMSVSKLIWMVALYRVDFSEGDTLSTGSFTWKYIFGMMD